MTDTDRKLIALKPIRLAAGMVAHQMVNDAEMAEHPYLVSKGFPKRRGLVLDELLILPIRSAYNDSLISVQTIDADGNKRFLKGGRVSLGVMRLGSRKARERWFCGRLRNGAVPTGHAPLPEP